MSQQSEFSSDGEVYKIISGSAKSTKIISKMSVTCTGLNLNSPNSTIQMILRPEGPQEDHLEDPRFLQLYQQATDIYGLIHARFILTPKGLNLMRQKYLRSEFGTCPRVLCQSQSVLPIGVSEQLRTCRVKVFCPRCEDVYNYQPKKKCINIDGAYFGGAFPHILLMSFQDLKAPKNDFQFSPEIFGFKIHGKHGSSGLANTLKEKPLQPSFLEQNSLTQTSVSKPKRKNNKKQR